LGREVKPALAESQREDERLRVRRDDLTCQLDGLAESRREATEQLGSITKRQLAEIKQLMRSPPDTVRRTLIAAWLLLHGDRFRGKSTVTFDETKDWPRCQRMLADDGFIAHILNFDLATLSEVPHVPRYVAAHFFGMYVPGALASEGGRGSTPELPQIPCAQVNSSTTSQTLVAPSTPPQSLGRSLARAATVPVSSPESAKHSPAARMDLIRTALRRSTKSCIEKPPLEVGTVAHASEPCGALLRWMLELVRDIVERERIERELGEISNNLETIQKRCAKLEGDAAELEARLAKALLTIEQKEQGLSKLRLEKETAKKAAQDLQKLEALVSQKARPPKQEAKTEKPKEIELELSGSMAHIEHGLAQLRVKFPKSSSKVLQGCAEPEQALTLPRVADMIKKQKGSKFLLEGHCEPGEKEGTDYDRCLAVFEWLVEAALCHPGSLRIKGRQSKSGEGRCVIPVLIEELVVRSGPISPEIAALGSKATLPGLFFLASSKELSSETKAILSKIAGWLEEDDLYIRVEGHVDENEKAALAYQRAQAVTDYLTGLGVSARQLKVHACGSQHPASRLHPELNRRVELHVD